MPVSALPEKVRTIFLSDLHLGYRFSVGANCLTVLNQISAEQIYLVGDCIDETRLQLGWTWTADDQRVVDKFIELQSSGTRVVVLPGNHDPYFREQELPSRAYYPELAMLLESMSHLEFSERVAYTSKNGKRWLVIHGDQFDQVETHLFGIPKLGSRIFDRINFLLPRSFVLFLRDIFKKLFAKPKEIESGLVEHVLQENWGGVIFGHLHDPKLVREQGIMIANCGDWLENESFLVETLEGNLKLFNFEQVVAEL